ncbi:hypothetical protein [Streptomyces luteogriseus]|uniref:hypothetical protein n=1 Tax=Streptomyces luteogriseus TaxID=68233 RepID=UPI003790B1FB
MSYDIYMCRFLNGEQELLDEDILQEILAPYVTAQDAENGFLQLKSPTGGGEADVYLTNESMITISHFGGDEIMSVISDLIRRLEAVLILPGGTVIVPRGADRDHLPQNFRDEWSVVVASAGAEITKAIQAS